MCSFIVKKMHVGAWAWSYLLKSLQDLPACCDQTLKSRAVTKQNKHKLSVLSSAQHPAMCPTAVLPMPRGLPLPAPTGPWDLCHAGETAAAPKAHCRVSLTT